MHPERHRSKAASEQRNRLYARLIYIAAFVAFLIGTAFSLWPELNSNNHTEILTFAGILLSFLLFMIVDRFVIAERLDSLTTEIDQFTDIRDEFNELSEGILFARSRQAQGALSDLIRVQGKDALTYLGDNAARASYIMNTGFFPPNFSRAPSYLRWIGGVHDALLNGSLTFDEVIIGAEEDDLKLYRGSLLELEDGPRSRWSYLSFPLSSMPPGQPILNLTIFDYPDGTTDVVLGWSVEIHLHYETTCFLSRDKFFSDLMKDYFKALKRAAKASTNASAKLPHKRHGNNGNGDEAH